MLNQLQPLANHLWQSTVFAAVAGLLTLALRKNHARIRYWLWLAASLKFLIPFSLLVALGSQFGRVPVAAAQSSLPFVIDEFSRPFTVAASLPAARPEQTSLADLLPSILGAAWAIGCVVLVTSWWRRWRQVRGALRAATPVPLPIGVEVRSSPAFSEPGVFGIFRPVLLLPDGIGDQLTPQQMQAIVAHELCHVRRRDNLFTAIHMVVEALFWFYPLVWWVGARLLEERERACDEEVLRHGSEPEVYAEGILRVCELYLESRVPCLAGVTGANLRKRIEEIMMHRITNKLDFGRKLLLGAAGTLAIAGPLLFGVITEPAIRAQTQLTPNLRFEVASVKPVKNPSRTDLRFPAFLPGGKFLAVAPLTMVVQAAYHLPFNPTNRLSGGPDWLRTNDSVYAIEATAGKDAIPEGLAGNAAAERMRAMLQTLLADRFKAVIRRETKELPVYVLVVGKGGPKLQKATIAEKDCPDPSTASLTHIPCHQFMGGQGRGLHAQAVDMDDLAGFVENWTGRPFVNKTGLKGLYKMDTKGWIPMQPGPPPAAGTKSEDGSDFADVPTLFQVMEGLGLKMEAQKDRVDTYVIDRIERPTEN